MTNECIITEEGKVIFVHFAEEISFTKDSAYNDKYKITVDGVRMTGRNIAAVKKFIKEA